MPLLVLLVAIGLAVGILAATILLFYTTLRMTRVWIFMLSIIISVPCLAIALYALLSDESDGTTKMWALGICGILVGYWLKSPFQVIRES